MELFQREEIGSEGIYETLTDDAKAIRKKVIMDVQGCPHIWMQKLI